MKVAVVILNWNGKKMLERFLPSVCRYTVAEDVEIVVADNGSTDDSIPFLETAYPQVRRILLEENYGFAGGYNRALDQLDSEYVVLLNSDVEVTENWLKPMIDYLDAHPETAACQPKIRSYNNRAYFEHAGACGGFIDYLGYPFCRGRVLNYVEKDDGQYDTVCEIFWATGASLFIRTGEYKNVGGLDDRFFAHMEEIDLCWRLRSRGKKIVCVPQSMVFHLGGGTLGVENPHKTFLNFRNNLLMIYKNEAENMRKILFIRFFLDYAAAFLFLLHGNWRNSNAVYEGRKAFRKMKPLYKKIRENNLSLTTNKNIPEIYPHSLILNFYFKGIRKFREWRK